jgi:hypothetical protein
MSAAARVEQPREDAGRAGPRTAEPADRAIGGHKGRGLQVTDQPVIADLGIACHKILLPPVSTGPAIWLPRRARDRDFTAQPAWVAAGSCRSGASAWASVCLLDRDPAAVRLYLPHRDTDLEAGTPAARQGEDLEVRVAWELLERAETEGLSLVGPGRLLAG